MNYYNEIDRHAAAWLRELIKEGLISNGEVDERDIREVRPNDLKGFVQCHFFAGIGGWSLALRTAEWPDARSIWTGSCPCQDFSRCGKQAGFAGDRDLWPSWFELIRVRRPDRLFGEQVDDAPEWYDRTAADLESIGYTPGAAILPTYATGGASERLRLYFAADAALFDGASRGCLGSRGIRRASSQSRRFPCLHVAGRWWREDEGGECLSTLVRPFDGLSTILAGFGNAIHPPTAAEFIKAYEETIKIDFGCEEEA